MTRRTARRQYDAEFASVRELLQQWDPLGVYAGAEHGEADRPRDEYDAYVPRILSLLRAGHGADRIAAHLQIVREQEMELPPDSAHDREVARRIEDWWRRRARER